jgi:hypothetical protein
MFLLKNKHHEIAKLLILNTHNTAAIVIPDAAVPVRDTAISHLDS